VIKRYWNIISEIGTDRIDNPILKRQVMLLNRICIIIMVLSTFKFTTEIMEEDWLGAAFACSFIILMSIPILLIRLKRYLLAKYVTVAFFIIPLVGLKVVYGNPVGSDFAYMIILVTSFVIFSDSKKLSIAVILILGAYVTGTNLFNIYGPLKASHTSFISTYHFMFIASAFSSLMITRMSLNGEIAEKEKSKELLNELKHNQEEIDLKNTNLARLNSELERFVYIASHDLKTPLRNITSFLGLIKRKVTHSKDPELIEYLEFVSSNSVRMHNLIEDILSYSVLSKNSSEMSTIDLNELILEVKSNMASVILEKNGLIRFTELPTILNDRSKFYLLFQNLVENALKYNRDAVPEVHISYEEGEETSSIVVKDNGIGIPEQYSTKIFDMFTRLHNVDEFSGTGIGLATCKRIVEESGGTITVNSSKNGSSFYLNWPKSVFKNVSAKETLVMSEVPY